MNPLAPPVFDPGILACGTVVVVNGLDDVDEVVVIDVVEEQVEVAVLEVVQVIVDEVLDEVEVVVLTTFGKTVISKL